MSTQSPVGIKVGNKVGVKLENLRKSEAMSSNSTGMRLRKSEGESADGEVELKVRRLFACIIIHVPMVDNTYMYKQLERNNLPVPKSSDKFYRQRSAFTMEIIRCIETQLQRGT